MLVRHVFQDLLSTDALGSVRGPVHRDLQEVQRRQRVDAGEILTTDLAVRPVVERTGPPSMFQVTLGVTAIRLPRFAQATRVLPPSTSQWTLIVINIFTY